MGRLTVVDIAPLGLHQVEGILKSVDPATGVVVVERPGGEIRLLAEGDTTIYIAGGPATLAELVEGTPVRASFSEEDRGRLAHWIEVPRDETPVEPINEPPAPIQAEPAPTPPATPPGGAAP